ncbi:MAG: hypothetical protein ACI9MR_002543 [Myxococcota bacterium]|jgi:hypothetical protein
MAELIRGGAPNGSNTFMWTSDHTRYDLTRLVRWNGIALSWADVENTDSDDQLRSPTVLRPYRCVCGNGISR